ncbi:MAG TPA: aminoacyl-tRNA hydrolase, partial [Thermodesulfatator sp.]|nr:aminoacyl-tRNA hydrolase [Thermodesulfatator sp.]
MWLVVGLGNPGPAYQITRHNVGFMVLDAMAKRLALKGWEEFCQALVLKSEKLSLAKPQTFMNLSGQSVSCLARQWQLFPEEILVVHDDLDLPLGRIKIVRSGGSGGHRGVASVI